MKKSDKKFQQESEWLLSEVQCIQSHRDAQYSDLNFLKPLLKDKRIVLLGENGHGVREHSEIKTKLVRYLYEELGFRVLAFESDLGNCSFSFNQQDKLSGRQLLQQSLPKVWHTEEIADLFSWIRTAAERKIPLTLTGIDIQPSSTESVSSKVIVSFFSSIGETLGAKVEDLERTLHIEYVNSYKNRNFTSEQKKTHMELKQGYTDLLYAIEQNQSALHKQYDQKTLSLMKRIVLNRGQLLEMIVCKNFRKKMKIRNKMMAGNIEWLANDLYKEEKIIIWAHNAHIFKKKQGLIGFTPTFSCVPEKLKEESYAIGLFMSSGKAAENNRTVYEVQQPESDSIEARLEKSGFHVSFLDISSQQKSAGSKWLFHHTYTMNEGKDLSLIKPSSCFDGLINCAETRAPQYY